MARIWAGLAAAALLFGACAGSDSSDDQGISSPTTTVPAPAPAPGESAPAPAERQVVASAAVHVRVKSVQDAATTAMSAVEKAGGYVGQQQINLDGDPVADIELRVPPGALTATLDGLAALGTVVDRSSKAEEVTARVVDLEGRLKTLQAAADRLRGLIREGRNTNDILAVENELAKREPEIESIQGQLRVLRDQIGLASVKAHFTQPAPPAVAQPKEGSRIPGFVPGLRAGWAALRNTVGVTVTVLGALLPWSPVLIGLGLLARRRRRPRTAVPAR